ncbi:MAG: hypothetical protein ACJAQ6_000584 [Arenicella sp.]|jgi:hypothetical protein
MIIDIYFDVSKYAQNYVDRCNYLSKQAKFTAQHSPAKSASLLGLCSAKITADSDKTQGSVY